MRVDALTPAHVRRAVDVFVAHSFPSQFEARPRTTSAQLEGAVTLEQLFALLRKEDDGGHGARRYSLTLGNHLYAFTKLVVTEYLIPGELFFSVDTHDNLPLSPSAPDYAKWLAVKRHNRALKEAIESDWRAAELPTFAQLREVCVELARVEREERKDRRVLIVDDERDIALAVAELCAGRGYDAEVAFTGEQVLARLGRDPLPDLALLDYELPDFDGGQLCQRMREDARLARIPLVMATAAQISLSRLGPVSGFLRKPYPRAMLFALLRGLLAPGVGTHREGDARTG